MEREKGKECQRRVECQRYFRDEVKVWIVSLDKRAEADENGEQRGECASRG